MKDEAVALQRISSYKQVEGHSLDAQKLSTEKMAEQLGVTIAESWSIIQTSNRGKNFGRKDMEQIFRYCKQNPKVGYLLIDFVNRLMREVEIMIYYKVRFNQMGVKLVFCDPAQHHLNADDQYAQLMLYLEGYKAEQDNAARSETSISRMKTRYEAGYYLSHPHAGYMKSAIAGLHAPQPERFKLLQHGSKLIIYEQHTPEQAVKWMNDKGYRTLGGKKLDVDHYSEFIVDRYYCGIIDIKKEGRLSDVKNVKGLHKPMFSKREHELLVAAINKRNPRMRYQHNPDYPLGNLLRHLECKDGDGYEKFTGHLYNPGKRPSGKQRARTPVYDCRDCRKRIDRDKTHDAFTGHLDHLELLPDRKTFKSALLKVWKQQRGTAVQRLAVLKSSKTALEQLTRETTSSYAKEPEGAVKNGLKLLLEDYDRQLKDISSEILNAQSMESESDGFVNFAIDFIDNIREKWWDLSWENHKRGEQILFNGEVYADSSAKVHTPNLSSIYRLGTNKKDLNEVNFSNMVELVEKNWHQIVAELGRWHEILAIPWNRYKIYGSASYTTPAIHH